MQCKLKVLTMAQAARQEPSTMRQPSSVLVPASNLVIRQQMIFFNALCLIAGHLVVDYHSFGLGNKWVREMGPTVVGSAIHN
jgi:hypothetical protein